MFHRIDARQPSMANQVHKSRPSSSLGMWRKPEELAGVAVFLASPASDYVNGQILYVDGGMTAVV